MPSRDAPPHHIGMHASLVDAFRCEECIAKHKAAVAIPNSSPKWVRGHKLLRDDPRKWFRGTQIDERDLALINASPLPWVDIGKQSFLKHVVRDNPQI